MELGNTTHYILLNSVVIVLAFSAVTDASYFEGDREDDDQATNIYGFSQTVFHTPPPPPTQETQTVTGEVNYGRGYREPRPPPQRLSPSGPRPRKT